MTKRAKVEAFQRLRSELNRFASGHVGCSIDHDSEKEVLLRMGEGDNLSYLDAGIGSFELVISTGQGLDYETLANDHDVERAMALCDAVIAGRGVSVSGPNGYPTRSWIFLDSRGFKEAVKATAVSIQSCRRARSIKKSLWQRSKLPVLKHETA
jgi:hypothetical protein